MVDDPLTILVVDDDEDCRLLVRDAIDSCPQRHEVYEASNGREAVEFLHKSAKDPSAPRPALIFLDVEMPGIGGQAVLKQIKSDPALRDIPVVMMTGVSDEAEIRQAALNGANSYTIKPADAEQFLRTVSASASYWMTVHQYPTRHLSAAACRR